MSNVDIVARLQLRAEQFSSETGRAFADMKTRATSAASDIRSTFASSFAEVQKLAQSSLTLPRSTTGSLDLSGEIAQLRASAVAAEQDAIAKRELSVAMSAAAAAGRGNAEALKLDADAAAVASIASERSAQASLDRAAALEAVQLELNKTTSATRLDIAATDAVTHSTGRMSIAKMEMMHVVRASSDAFAAGAPVTQIFSMELGRMAEAAALSGGSMGKLGAFLGGGWGIALTAGLAVAAPFVAKLFEGGDASDKLHGKVLTLADALSKERFATDEARKALEDYNAEKEKAQQNDSLANDLALQSAKNRLSDALATRAQIAAQIDKAYADANAARFVGGGQILPVATEGQAAAARNFADIETLNQTMRDLDAAIAADAAKAVDPIVAINQQYQRMADTATRAAKANNQLAAALKGTLIEIEKQHQAALKTERDRQSAERKTTAAGPLTPFVAPLHGPISSQFGLRSIRGGSEMHPGIDIAVPVGTAVRAPAAGTIDGAGLRRGYGNLVTINFGGGTTGRFGHLSKITAKVGETVNAGDIIGYSGGAAGAEGAGNSTGAHLHYEIRRNGRAVDPRTGAYPTDPGSASDDASRQADAAKRKQEAATRAAEQFANAQQRAQDIILGISASWDEQPRLIDRARIETNKLNEIITAYGAKTDEASKAIVVNAEAAKRSITEGINRPFNDYMKNQRESLAIQTLTLQGRDVEANAMQDALRIQQAQGFVTKEQLADVYRTAEQQERISRALEDQRRIVSIYGQAVGDMQRGFDQFLDDVEKKGVGAFGGLASNWLNTFKTLQKNLLSNAIFGGIDRKVEDYIRKMTGQKTPAEILADQASDSGKVMRSAYEEAGSAVTDFADTFRRVTGTIGGSETPLSSATGGVADTLAEIVRRATQGDSPSAANDNAAWDERDIVITATRNIDASMQKFVTTSGVFGVVVDGLVDNLHRLGIDLPKALTDNLKKYLPDILKGAAIGQIGGSVFASITGGKNNSTASSIGGAIGGFLTGKDGPLNKVVSKGLESIFKGLGGAAGPIGAVVGGVLGNLVGGLFKKAAPSGGSVLTSAYGDVATHGNNSAARAAAGSAGGNVQQALVGLAQQFGVDLGSFMLSIGERDGKWSVDPLGLNRSAKPGGGGVAFGEDEQAAIEFAIRDAIADGALKGISAASQKILSAGGGNLANAITKAMAIESIPRDLKAMLDPLGAAIDDVNRKWKITIDALKEGGATAEQFAQAEQLYKLQLDQVKASTASASQGLKDFLASLKFGSNSPYSLRDQEASAKAALQPYLDTISAGGSIDQGKYQEAAKAFLDIERDLYGSTQDYFDALDGIQAATNKAIAAIDNAVPITPGVPDPFTKATADNVQTGNELLSQVSGQLSDITSLLAGLGSSGTSGFIGEDRSFLSKVG